MADTPPASGQQDIAALAKGGRTNLLGFLLRLLARIPFLIIASRFYGAPAMGRFASALVMVEFAGMLATLGQKRGLAQRLAEDHQHPANTVGDAVLLALGLSLGMGAAIYAFPESMYPSGNFTLADRLLVLAIPGLALGDLALAALAYRFDVATTVRARSIVEPWTISIGAGVFWMIWPASGLSLAYLLSIWGATAVALFSLVRSYGLPKAWEPRPGLLWQIAKRNFPLAGADAVEWGTRKLDVFILRFFVGEAPLGIYYFAQQFASLPQKLKTSFEPVLGPVITRSVKDKDYTAIAKQVCQVGFWITAAQIGIAMALGIPGEGLMGLGGPAFVSGTAALVFLLLAEVVASKAVVSEAALVYLARMRNLWISLATIGLQLVLTIGFILIARNAGWDPMYIAAAAALALVVSLGLASFVKSRVLAKILGHSISNWRWGLAWAVLPAAAVGVTVTLLPEWAELSLGIPAILAIYGTMLWFRSFDHDDRMLFRKQQVT
ncbi:O-antigen/teichoic acid export membrane protein [Novosphingobium hassiacum]|uniref:O-antigen/teichoic acid export membrane protein n=1 Tax=Novosphingobium hassiacum TaxID=173676 RepID=A0A7W6A1V6_9SPHN|nr:lipopolysaccharide biosynthesis protein [Novosphingobium hassiacum]MBB3861735.1 O-antigen/teichoic acid export membrane protein [Novosphingobium hassiacum]